MTFRPTLLRRLTLLLIPLTCVAGTAPAATPSLSRVHPTPPTRQATAPNLPVPPDDDPPTPGRPPPAILRPGRFTWPLAPPHRVVRPFQPPSTPYGPGHRGVDVAAPVATPVLAAGDGVVIYAGLVAGRGVVSIKHEGGIHTTYEPVTATVTPGQHVNRGTVIGHLTAGHCPDTCLHWGARRGQEYLDPLGLLSTGHVRLKPWNGPTA